MKRVIHHLEDKQIKTLANLSERTGKPQAEFVREALDLYLPFVTPDSKAAEVLEEAQKTFSDARTPPDALNRALFNRFYNRQEDSKSSAIKRIEARMTILEAKVDRLLNTLEPGK